MPSVMLTGRLVPVVAHICRVMVVAVQALTVVKHCALPTLIFTTSIAIEPSGLFLPKLIPRMIMSSFGGTLSCAPSLKQTFGLLHSMLVMTGGM